MGKGKKSTGFGFGSSNPTRNLDSSARHMKKVCRFYTRGGSEITILKKPTKIVEKLIVDSRYNCIYKKLIAKSFVLVIEPIKIRN
jgi:hypothetical protein